MERKRKLNRRDFLKASAFLAASAALSACAEEVPIVTSAPERRPASTWTLPPKIASQLALTPTAASTVTPLPIPETSTPPPTGTPEKPTIPEFVPPKIGNADLSKPFKIILPVETARLAYLWGGEKTFSIDVPKIITGTELTDDEQKLIDPHNIPGDPNDPNSRVGLIFQTNNARTIMLNAHSGYNPHSLLLNPLPLEPFRRIIKFNENKMIGTGFSVEDENKNRTNLVVVGYKKIKEEVSNLAFGTYKNDDDPLKRNLPLFLRFEKVCDEVDGKEGCIDINSYPYNTGDQFLTLIACAGGDLNISDYRFVITAKVIDDGE